MDSLSKQFPDWLWDEFITGVRSIMAPPPPPDSFRLLGMFDNEPRLRFPLIEKAAERLSQRNVLTRKQWDATTDAARQRAFMITGDITEDTLADVRTLLVASMPNPKQQGLKLEERPALQRRYRLGWQSKREIYDVCWWHEDRNETCLHFQRPRSVREFCLDTEANVCGVQDGSNRKRIIRRFLY